MNNYSAGFTNPPCSKMASLSIMDDVNKRRAAFYIILAFQLAKASIMIQQSRQADDRWVLPTIGWLCLADIVYFTGLRWAKVPWLRLNVFGTVVIILSFCLVNSGLVAIASGQVSLLTASTPAPENFQETRARVETGLYFSLRRYFGWLAYYWEPYGQCSRTHISQIQSKWYYILHLSIAAINYRATAGQGLASFLCRLRSAYAHIWDCAVQRCRYQQQRCY